MKFTDGYWMVREGLRWTRPAEAYEVASQRRRSADSCSDRPDQLAR